MPSKLEVYAKPREATHKQPLKRKNYEKEKERKKRLKKRAGEKEKERKKLQKTDKEEQARKIRLVRRAERELADIAEKYPELCMEAAKQAVEMYKKRNGIG